MAELKIGSLLFQTKKDAGNYFANLISGIEAPQRFESGKVFSDFANLLLRHPEADRKIGIGLSAFEVRIHETWVNHNALWLVRIDSTEEIFSWRKCIRGSDWTHWHYVMQAARRAISQQVLSFKTKQFSQSDFIKCAISGSDVCSNTCHIDHVAPFAVLFSDFMKNQNLTAEDIVLSDCFDINLSRDFASEELKKNWIDYHEQNAVLRITTVEANLSRRD